MFQVLVEVCIAESKSKIFKLGRVIINNSKGCVGSFLFCFVLHGYVTMARKASSCCMPTPFPRRATVSRRNLVNRSERGVRPVSRYSSVVFVPQGRPIAIRNALLSTSSMLVMAVLHALAVITLPYSSTGLMYCLYNFNIVRLFAPQVRPRRARRRLVFREAISALYSQCFTIERPQS